MILTGRHPENKDLKHKPEKLFLKDIKGDLDSINKHYEPKTAKIIKLKMVEMIIKNI